MVSHNEKDTIEFGKRIGKKLNRSSIVALYGKLGAGKTVLIKGIVKGLGCETQVKSPSFVFVHEYKGNFPVYHIDLYRMTNTDDILTLGIHEFFTSNGVCLIEWAERAKELLPNPHIDIRLKILDKTTREINVGCKQGLVC